MNGCSALMEREKKMGESGERADIEKALIGSGLAARPHGISLRGAKTKGKCALKQNPNALHVACSFPKSSPTLLRSLSCFSFSDGKKHSG